MEHLIIGIAGGTGSGKSTFAERLAEEFKEDMAVIYYDNYYKARNDIPLEERKKINYDHPDAFDTDLLIRDIKKLKNDEEINSPVYDFTCHNRSSSTRLVRPKKIILIEGIFTLQNQEIRDLLDIKIYVETDADERILRRTIRDIKERGRSLEDIYEQYVETVKPMHNLYVEPTKALADLIINGGFNNVAFDICRAKISEFLKK